MVGWDFGSNSLLTYDQITRVSPKTHTLSDNDNDNLVINATNVRK